MSTMGYVWRKSLPCEEPALPFMFLMNDGVCICPTSFRTGESRGEEYLWKIPLKRQFVAILGDT